MIANGCAIYNIRLMLLLMLLQALVPKFQETYNFSKDGDVDAEQAQVKQLKRQLKRERKGAVRYFCFGVTLLVLTVVTPHVMLLSSD
jgi:Nop14-like family